MVKRLCRELNPALVRGNRDDAQVEAQADQTAKDWASLHGTPEANTQTSLYIVIIPNYNVVTRLNKRSGNIPKN